MSAAYGSTADNRAQHAGPNGMVVEGRNTLAIHMLKNNGDDTLQEHLWKTDMIFAF